MWSYHTKILSYGSYTPLVVVSVFPEPSSVSSFLLSYADVLPLTESSLVIISYLLIIRFGKYSYPLLVKLIISKSGWCYVIILIPCNYLNKQYLINLFCSQHTLIINWCSLLLKSLICSLKHLIFYSLTLSTKNLKNCDNEFYQQRALDQVTSKVIRVSHTAQTHSSKSESFSIWKDYDGNQTQKLRRKKLLPEGYYSYEIRKIF